MAIALGRSWPRSNPACWVVGGQASPISTAQTGPAGPSAPHAYVLGPELAQGPGSWEPVAPRNTNEGGPHIGKGHGAFYGPVADPWASERAQRGGGLQATADDTNASMSFAHGLRAYVAGPFRAPVPGLERPGTLRLRQGADYVTWAPGAQVTPHREGPGTALTTEEVPFRVPTITLPGLQEPWQPRIVEGSPGHAMCPGPARLRPWAPLAQGPWYP